MADLAILGEVGTLRGGASDYALIWRIIRNAHVTLEDIENEWTWERLNSFGSYLQMVDDHGSAWRAFFDEKNEKENQKGMNYG